MTTTQKKLIILIIIIIIIIIIKNKSAANCKYWSPSKYQLYRKAYNNRHILRIILVYFSQIRIKLISNFMTFSFRKLKENVLCFMMFLENSQILCFFSFMRVASLCCMHDCKLQSKLIMRKLKVYIDIHDTRESVLTTNSPKVSFLYNRKIVT